MAVSSISLSDRLISAEGRPSGFDYLRLFLAVSVVTAHTVVTSYGIAAENALWATPARNLLLLILPMFFALSGFLVAGSLYRCKTIIMFLGLRAVRIVPALFVETVVSALIIGPIITDKSLHDYFSDRELFRYLLNVSGHISYFLPGVFESNPLPRTVNAQLWTVPYELYCYLFLGLTFIVGMRKKPYVILVSIVAFCLLHVLMRMQADGWAYKRTVLTIPGALLIMYFAAGVALYTYRSNVPFHRGIFAVCSIISVFLVNVDFGEYFAVPLIAYMTIYIGLCNPRRNPVVASADYSYGIYLYGFVVQQLIMHMFPPLRHWFLNLIVCLPASAILAAVSWHLIEKPALRLRFLPSKAENYFLSVDIGQLGRIIRPDLRTREVKQPPSRL